MSDSSPYFALRRAVAHQQTELLDTLLSLHPSIDLNLPDFDVDPTNAKAIRTHRTPIFHVRSVAVAKRLLEAGAKLDVHDKYGRTPVHIATDRQDLALVQCLLQHQPQMLQAEDGNGNTPLFDAEKPELLKFLLDSGCSVSHTNSLGDTVLHVACRTDRLELAKLLLCNGANPNATNHRGRTPIHGAAENGHKEIVRLLLSPAASPPIDVNAADHAGWTALHYSCLGAFPEHESHTPIVDLLLKHGASVHLADVSGLRPIHVCTDTSALRLLLAAGAEPDAVDQDGRSPLHTLSTDNAVLLVEMPTVDLHRRDRYQRTPLHVAAEPDQVRLLIAKGCDKDALDQDGKTPLDWAIQTVRPEVAEVLRQFGASTSAQLKRAKQTRTALKTLAACSALAIPVVLLIKRLLKRKQPV